MDCANDTVVPGCAVDDSVIPSLLSVLASEIVEDAPFDEKAIHIHEGDRERMLPPSSSRVRLRNGNSNDRSFSPPAPPAIEPSQTADTENSSPFSSTAGVIDQTARSMYQETSDYINRTRDDVHLLTRRLMHAVSMDEVVAAAMKSPSPQQKPLVSQSTASFTRERIRKAGPDPTNMSTHSFPPLSPSINFHVNNNKHLNSNDKFKRTNNSNAMNMFSYKGPLESKQSVTSNQHKMRQQDSIVSIETSPDSPLQTETRSNEEIQIPNNSNNVIHRILPHDHSDLDQTVRIASSFASKQSEAAGTTHKIVVTRAYEVKEHLLETILYISTSAILGSTARVYLARIFGADCEKVRLVNDFLASSYICVTNSGRTMQTGGALFYDFPANVLGSFVMGLITPSPSDNRSRFPWMHRDHPLQRDDVLHASLGTGFCGCLTTFASWNAQMVYMLDGSYCELGSQVFSVMFGYMIGLMGATCGFLFGRQCGLWMHNFRNAGEHDQDDHPKEGEDEELLEENTAALYREPSTHHGIELVDDDEVKLKPVPNHLHKIPLFLLAFGLLVAFLFGNFEQDIQFYRGMTILWFVAPFGSLLRWRLSRFNLTEGKVLCFDLPKWVPWGTFMTNMIAASVSACLTGIFDRYYSTVDPLESNWTLGLIFALISGFSGSLSTVSTMIKESVLLSEQYVGSAKAQFYAVGTCLCGMLLGLAIYSTTVRVNT
ncbi:CrcB-like protein, Camphor resistance CrcB [Nitzschia inconspicua]|uniref:CrcB-like protein, Camphor resistance CrcB n=1 Tax=Nitzschia inconspicua TaxID=303405 RepID=A0A9K3KDM0_9STRA|nr:CrcB-like protein, Camphor resistance CrcB [Nitzschia inconspicua]